VVAIGRAVTLRAGLGGRCARWPRLVLTRSGAGDRARSADGGGGGLIIAARPRGGKPSSPRHPARADARRYPRQSFKVGPDYIDPAFMRRPRSPLLQPQPRARPPTIAHLPTACDDAELILGEGVMDLFDGASDGTGSTADLAAMWAAGIHRTCAARPRHHQLEAAIIAMSPWPA
jgi:hypothetical protein